MLQRPPACDGCPANATARGFVPPTGPTNAIMAICGQGPGADEAAFGEPFIGTSGTMLNRWLASAGIPREKLAINNVVQCQLPGNREPHKREAQHCWRAHVRPWLASLTELRVIVPVGVPAMEVLIDPECSASVAGTLHPIPMPWKGDPYVEDDIDSSSVRDIERGTGVPSDRVVVAVPVLHPAGIMRGGWAQEPAQIDFLRRAWAIATGKVVPDLSPLDEPPPGCNPTPTYNDVRNFETETSWDEPLACDIEGTRGRLIGIGWARLRDEATIYVPFLDGEKPYWNDVHWPGIDVAIRALLQRPLIFHNGSGFDIGFLESCGYQVPRYVDDTMIRHHILYAEQPKGLEALAVRYVGARAWKWLSHVENEDDSK